MAFRPIVLTVTTDPKPGGFERHGEPVSIGVACPCGVARASDRWGLTDQSGRAVAVQTTTLDRWADGSVRWLLAEFHADVVPDAPSYFALAPDLATPDPPAAIGVADAGDMLRVDTGAAVFDVPRCGPGILIGARVGDAPLLRGATITAEDAEGVRYAFAGRELVVERSGPLRLALRLDGGLTIGRTGHWLDVTVRLQFFAGLGTIKVDVEVTNPRASRHPGGQWDLGDPGSVLIRDLSIDVHTVTTEGDVWGSLDQHEPMEPAGARFLVHQDSSGGSNWQHSNHVNRDNQVPFSFRGFRAMRDDRLIEGLRATPIASIGGGSSRVSVTVPRFWQLFPKSIEAETGRCRIGMFPSASKDLHELQGGERTTLTLGICFGRDTVTPEPLAWLRQPSAISADPLSYRQAGTWAPLSAGSRLGAEGYEMLVNSAIKGDTAFEQRREIIDEYGWRHFGELYADHEAVFQPLVSHYNNQYDPVAGFLTRFMQTADRRWWRLGDELGTHVMDIDLYHTTRDRAAYNGGYFWHTQHYIDAGTATHRAYSRRTSSHGGGGCSEHNYTTGLMLHYFLTGSGKSRAAVVQLANWVIDMDDGRKSRFRWIDRRDTGLASVTRSMDYHGPGRGAGNSINALIDAHRLTGEPRYLEKAEQLVRRCVDPDEDPGAVDPLDAENRWSYTVFFQVLGKYLEYRAERGLIDEHYEYARLSLLNWASWMAAHERPYLDTPDRLEYPTETWAAQDIRKAAVFEFAARHSHDAASRAQFLARADAFVDYSVTTLLQAKTGRLTRPLVVLLAYGFMRPMAEAAVVAHSLPLKGIEREAFTPLRQRVKNRLALAGAGLSAAAVLVIALLIS